jgi:hypothetical protein
MGETRIERQLKLYELRTAKWKARAEMFGTFNAAAKAVGVVVLITAAALVLLNPQGTAAEALALVARLLQ